MGEKRASTRHFRKKKTVNLAELAIICSMVAACLGIILLAMWLGTLEPTPQ